MTTTPASYDAARDRLLAGDLDGLAAALRAEPGLACARSGRRAAPHDGYFHAATLLQHCAGNPFLRPLPVNVVDAARLLLDHGAEVDAATRPGPCQPDDIGWTTLGLAASSSAAREAGVQLRLLDLLLERGADPDARGGGAMMGALYYGEGGAARHLAAAGARLDAIAAAGVGELEQLSGFLELSDEELAAAPRLVHYCRVPWPAGCGPAAAAAHVRGLALAYAALHERTEALRLLLEAGADPDHRPPFEHGATALHWAVMGDAPASVAVLLEAGADPSLRCEEFGSTPRGWAEHLGRPRALAALERAGG